MYMTIKLSQLLLNLYVVSCAGSFSRHAVYMLSLREYYDLYDAMLCSPYTQEMFKLLKFLPRHVARAQLFPRCSLTNFFYQNEEKHC